jgi:hypothetical protein
LRNTLEAVTLLLAGQVRVREAERANAVRASACSSTGRRRIASSTS